MNNPLTKDTLISGIMLGGVVIVVFLLVLKMLDYAVSSLLDRPLFTKPDALQLIILATLVIMFRQRFKTGSFENGKGLFLITFLATMAYLVWKKTNFATWQDFV